MALHEGEILRKAFCMANITAKEALPVLKVARATLYSYYKMESLDPEFKKRAAELLHTTVEELFTLNKSPETQKPDESGEWKTKYYSLLQESYDRQKEFNLSLMQKAISDDLLMIRALQKLVIERFAALEGVPPADIQAALGSIVIGLAQEQKKDNKSSTSR